MAEGWRRVEDVSRTLSLAVQLTDGVVGGRPRGDFRVRVDGVDERPHRNPSGYYLFFDLPPEEVTVTVDGRDRFRDAAESVNLDPTDDDTHDPGDALEVVLEPTAAYPFPSGLTRVRGTVRDTDDTPVPGATVTVADHDRSLETGESGEFFYYFDGVVDDDIVRRDPLPDDPTNVVNRLYRPGGADPTFVVDGPPGHLEQSVEVAVGTLTTWDLTY